MRLAPFPSTLATQGDVALVAPTTRDPRSLSERAAPPRPCARTTTYAFVQRSARRRLRSPRTPARTAPSSSRTCAAGKGLSWGYNAATDTYEDLVQSGVIDPAKVVRMALQNASSVASLLLTTDALVSDLPERAEAESGHGHRH